MPQHGVFRACARRLHEARSLHEARPCRYLCLSAVLSGSLLGPAESGAARFPNGRANRRRSIGKPVKEREKRLLCMYSYVHPGSGRNGAPRQPSINQILRTKMSVSVPSTSMDTMALSRLRGCLVKPTAGTPNRVLAFDRVLALARMRWRMRSAVTALNSRPRRRWLLLLRAKRVSYEHTAPRLSEHTSRGQRLHRGTPTGCRTADRLQGIDQGRLPLPDLPPSPRCCPPKAPFLCAWPAAWDAGCGEGSCQSSPQCGCVLCTRCRG